LLLWRKPSRLLPLSLNSATVLVVLTSLAHGQFPGRPLSVSSAEYHYRGWVRQSARSRLIHLALVQETRLDDFVIVTYVEGVVQLANIGMWVNRIRDFLQNELRLHVLSFSNHPFGL
jgi:hypothetical protein